MHETARLLRELVALPSVNPMGRSIDKELAFEHRVTDYLQNCFCEFGLAFERRPVAPLRDNIIAHFPGNRSKPGILFEVHQDTVPTDNMTIPPFEGRIENGRLYGRGACDVKGGMAAMLHVMHRLARERPASAAPVWLACTVDEEHTFLGVQEYMKNPPPAEMAIVAEPTRLEIVNAHKGVARWVLETSGRSCHSSAPEQGINAIFHMGRLLPAIERYAQKLQASRSDPVLGSPTLSVGRIEGGQSANIVPDRCRIEIDRRLLPGESAKEAPEQLARYLRSAVGDIPFSVSEPWLYAPALGSEKSGAVVQRLSDAIRSVGRQPSCGAVPFGTDASTIALGGIPSVVFGPGDIAKAHTCDEWAPLDELEMASEILYCLVCQN
jgi:acetylornithine deacetylase/succinyl-diaminopimelate desuccinylase family protein